LIHVTMEPVPDPDYCNRFQTAGKQRPTNAKAEQVISNLTLIHTEI